MARCGGERCPVTIQVLFAGEQKRHTGAGCGGGRCNIFFPAETLFEINLNSYNYVLHNLEKSDVADGLRPDGGDGDGAG
jgi:hypothetical protein